MSTDPKRLKIALFGNFGTGNLGNEATLQAMVYNLRRNEPNTEISCICPEPENVAAECNISAFPIRASFPLWKAPAVPPESRGPSMRSNGNSHGTVVTPRRLSKALARLRAPLRTCAYPLLEAYRWLKGVAALKGSDLLVMTGTGMLSDYATQALGLHYDIFRWSLIAKLCRCKVLFVSVGSGPIRHPLSRLLVRAALAMADYRSYRDDASQNHLEAIGADVKNDAVYPDLAFSLPRALATAERDAGPVPVIGVGLINYYNRLGRSGNDETIYRDYLGRLASFVVRLRERKCTVRILIGDMTWDQGVRHDLRRVLEERGMKYEGGGIIDEPASSVDELLSQLSSVDLVVSSRFHNLLLSLMLGKPVVSISYHEKFQPLMNGVGLGAFCQDIEHIDVDELIEKVAKVQENAPRLRFQIERKTESYRVALDEQYERILNLSCRGLGTSHAQARPAS